MSNKHISQLPAALTMNDGDLLVCEQNGVAKRLTGSILMAMINSHGGITGSSYTPPVAPSLQGTLTLTFTDGASTSIPIYNGAQGAQGIQGIQGERGAAFTYEDFTPEQLESLRGEQGIQGVPGNPGYVHIKWASVEPTSDADIGDIPDDWMGIYSGTSSTAPVSYTEYTWVRVKGATGAQGMNGADGARGSFIWQSLYPVHGSDYNHYFLLSDLIQPVAGYAETPQYGDMAIYGDNYYFFSVRHDGDKYYVGTEYSLNSAALPDGGTTGQVLGKASDNDFDVVWKDAGGGDFVVTYGSTSLSAMRQAGAEGKRLKLTYNNRSYTVAESTGGLNDGTIIFTCAADDGTIYWCKAEKASAITPTTTWTNGSVSGGGTTDYTDLTNKPSINSVTLSGNKTAADLSLASASDLAAKYTKPSGGIPSTDLASTVQTSLGKADNAIPAPSSPATGAFLVWNGSAWTAQTLSTWQGGNY